MLTALIDSDSVVYKSGFAGQKTVVHELPDGDSIEEIIAEPVENILHTVKLALEGIMEATGADWPPRVFLTGKENYRDKIATIRPYKGNRDKLKRPVHYQAIRDYLVKFWGAEVVEGEEADDRISILARTPEFHDKCVIASIDKDLDQIPGKHWDFLKQVSYDVREDEAEFVFYRQALSGDSVDNVPGCYNVGLAKAERLLNDTPRKAWWDAIVSSYEASKGIPGCPYADRLARDVAIETAQLVRLRTYDGEIWRPNE